MTFRIEQLEKRERKGREKEGREHGCLQSGCRLDQTFSRRNEESSLHTGNSFREILTVLEIEGYSSDRLHSP